MNKKILFFIKLSIYKLVPRPKNIPILLDRWVFKIKKRLNKFILYKVRWIIYNFE